MGLRKPDKTDTGGGIVLPELTNPATAENIESGFQAIDGNGVMLEGVLEKVEFVKGTVKTSAHDGYYNNKLSGLPVGKLNGVLYYTDSASYTPSNKVFIIENGIAVGGVGSTYAELDSSTYTYDSTTGVFIGTNKSFCNTSTANKTWNYIMW